MENLDIAKKSLDDATEKGACLVQSNSAPGGLQLVSPKAVSRHSPGDLASLAQEIQKADVVVHASATAKLELILAQVRHLQEMAKKVILEAKQSADLHHAACNFRKVPGFTYHLYRRDSGQLYFSMLSPQDWAPSNAPHEFVGSYRLEHDMSWTPAERVASRDADLNLVQQLLNGDMVRPEFINNALLQ